MSHDTYVILSVALAALVVVVLALALIEVRRGLRRISENLAVLDEALQGVESQHLRPLVDLDNAAMRGQVI